MATTMVGTQAPQKLFGDMPARTYPGAVTPNITVAMPDNMNSGDDEAAKWARAAAINNARMAQQARGQWANGGWNQGQYLPSTASQSSGMGAQYRSTAGGRSPSVMWAPRNLQGPQLGTWASQQQNRAIAENREIPMIMQAHTGDPFSPGETQGGSMAPTSSRGLYGPGLTSPLGGANSAVLARMWSGDGGGNSNFVGGSKQGTAANPFPTQSLRERTLPTKFY